jgi:hypothetical protein
MCRRTWCTLLSSSSRMVTLPWPSTRDTGSMATRRSFSGDLAVSSANVMSVSTSPFKRGPEASPCREDGWALTSSDFSRPSGAAKVLRAIVVQQAVAQSWGCGRRAGRSAVSRWRRPAAGSRAGSNRPSPLRGSGAPRSAAAAVPGSLGMPPCDRPTSVWYTSSSTSRRSRWLRCAGRPPLMAQAPIATRNLQFLRNSRSTWTFSALHRPPSMMPRSQGPQCLMSVSGERSNSIRSSSLMMRSSMSRKDMWQPKQPARLVVATRSFLITGAGAFMVFPP